MLDIRAASGVLYVATNTSQSACRGTSVSSQLQPDVVRWHASSPGPKRPGPVARPLGDQFSRGAGPNLESSPPSP